MTDRILTLEIKNTNNITSKRKISNVNVASSDTVLYNFAVKLISLTTNTLIAVYKGDTTLITGA